MASHKRKQTPYLWSLARTCQMWELESVGTEGENWTRWLRPLVVMVLNLKLRILGSVSYGGKKTRHGVKRPGFKFWFSNIPAMCPWANEVLRYYFCLLMCKMEYCLLYILYIYIFPQNCSEDQMRFRTLNPEPFEFWLERLQSSFHSIVHFNPSLLFYGS